MLFRSDVIIFRWIVFLVFSSSFSGYFLGIFLWFWAVEIGEWSWVRWRLASEFVTDVGVGQMVQRRRGFLAVMGL